MEPIRGIIFDMDGVLCLSEPFIAEAACRMFVETHRVQVTPRDFEPFVGTGEDRFLGGVAEQYGVSLVMPRDKTRTYEIYLQIIQGQLQPLPGVKQFITSCRRNKLKLAVATSADRVKLDGNLREIGLPAAKFDATVNGDEIERKKPAPDIFLLAAKRLGLKPAECLVIEDAPSGIAAAKAGGFRCLGLTTSFPAEKLRGDWVAADLENVPKELTKLFSQPAQPVAAANPPSPGLKILFVAAECAPYAKTGGLGDVVAGLAKALRRLGHDARVVLPLYGSIDRAKHGVKPAGTACVHMGNREEQWIGVQQAMMDEEVPVWFVDCERYFGRAGIYGYDDDAFRFALLSKAALQVSKDQQFYPDVVHGHDWHTALTSVFLKTWDRVLSPLSNTASVLTIHNIGYQGVVHSSLYGYLGLGPEHLTPDRFEDHGRLNLLKAGLYFSDAITTVSPTHAQEILTPSGGMGLAPFVATRRNDFFGILNGCDYEHWNPTTDLHIPARYTAADLSGKAVCKAALQQRMGLALQPAVPLFGVVSRFAQQKGFDLLARALPRALDTMDLQCVVLGAGDAGTESFFRSLTTAYPGRVGSYIGYHNDLSHLIEAGSDFFLMPSLYEPCGLNQMYSLKYGTLPIVRATGGLQDSVTNYEEATGAGTGFKFTAATAQALSDTIGWAVSTWYDRPRHIEQLRRTAMNQDFSWKGSAQKYVEVYQHAITRRRTVI